MNNFIKVGDEQWTPDQINAFREIWKCIIEMNGGKVPVDVDGNTMRAAKALELPPFNKSMYVVFYKKLTVEKVHSVRASNHADAIEKVRKFQLKNGDDGVYEKITAFEIPSLDEQVHSICSHYNPRNELI